MDYVSGIKYRFVKTANKEVAITALRAEEGWSGGRNNPLMGISLLKSHDLIEYLLY
jgi:hypothetical protein